MRILISFLCVALLASPAFTAEPKKRDFSKKAAVEKTEPPKKTAKSEKKKEASKAPEKPKAFSLKVGAFDKNGFIRPEHAFCVGAGKNSGHGENISPAVSWEGAPEGTQSFALVMHDPDVPTDFSNAGKEGVEIDGNQNRQIFYHWVLADIPAKTTALKEGAEGKGVKLNKTKPGKSKTGTRGVNDYTKFMKDDPKLAGTYAGYDGPCPPWNDSRPHRYIFTLYALKTPSLKLPENFTGQDVVHAVRGNVLAQTSVQGKYALNPRFVKKSKAVSCH